MTQPSTNIYFDFEFIDDGREIVPISLGMCSGPIQLTEKSPEVLAGQMQAGDYCDCHLYIEYQFDPARANDWVRENVFPHLDCMQENHPESWSTGVARWVAARRIKAWVADVCGDTKPRFWGYFPSYDFVLLCQHFGTMMQTPKGWPMRPECLMQMADERGVPTSEFPKQEKEHHALADAKWNRDLHHMLMERPGKGGELQ